MAIIETSSLTRSYGTRRGIESINLAVPQGSLFGFLGPNGAGKTTAIRVMVGLLRPTGGTARVLGLDCWRDSRAIKAELGYMPGDVRLYPWMDGTLALGIWQKIRRREMTRHGRELAARFDLDLSVKVRNMSRGMRQKLGLILALAHRPRLLILDEPTVTLDPLMQAEVQKLLREMAAAGHTIFFSSHTLGEVDQLCDRVAMIRRGRLVANESLESLRRRAGHQVTIRWPDALAAAVPCPEFLKVERQAGDTWSGMLEGPVERLVQWLAARRFDDLTIGPPDLESLFHGYYAAEESAR